MDGPEGANQGAETESKTPLFLLAAFEVEKLIGAHKVDESEILTEDYDSLSKASKNFDIVTKGTGLEEKDFMKIEFSKDVMLSAAQNLNEAIDGYSGSPDVVDVYRKIYTSLTDLVIEMCNNQNNEILGDK